MKSELDKLPPEQKQVLEMAFYEGLSQSEIAEMVGVSQVHVSRLLRKSIRMLQQQLGHGGGDLADDDDDGQGPDDL